MVPESTSVPGRNPNRDDETGRYTEGYTPEDALEALRSLDGVATTSEVAEKIGCARRTASINSWNLKRPGALDRARPGGHGSGCSRTVAADEYGHGQ
jgi:hypothetical protein